MVRWAPVILGPPLYSYVQPRSSYEIPARVVENGTTPCVELELVGLTRVLRQTEMQLVIQRNAKRLAEDMLRTGTVSRRYLEDELVTKTGALKDAENEIELLRARLVLARTVG